MKGLNTAVIYNNNKEYIVYPGMPKNLGKQGSQGKDFINYFI